MAIEHTVKLNVDAKDGIQQVDKLKKGVKDTSSAAKGSEGSFSKMKAGVQGLGVAFKALGIGLVVAALMKLKDIFSGNIETARRFERISAQLSAAFDVIRDRAENFIKSLIALKNPFKAFKEAFTGTTAEIKEEVKAIDTLTVALQKVRDEERDMLLVRAKANKIIAESRLLAEDDNLSMQERLDALKAAVAEEKRVADIEVATQAKKVEAMQEIIDLGKSSEEDMQNLAAERARLIELQTASVLKQKRVAAEIGTFTNQIAKEQEKVEKERLERIDLLTKAKEFQLEITKEMSNKEIAELIKSAEAKNKLDDAQKLKDDETKQKSLDELRQSLMTKEELELHAAQDKYEKLLAIANKYGQDTTVLTEQYNQQVQDIENKYNEEELANQKAIEANKTDIVLNAMSNLATIAGQESRAGKALAVGQALINTYQGVTKALASGSPPWNFIQAAAVGVAGMKNVAKIKSTNPESGGNDDPPDIPSPSPEPSGVDVGGMLPNMETIIPEVNGATQPIQAYVIENDISDAQALQEELDLQATL